MLTRNLTALASAALIVAGCALPRPSPDTAYQQALETAIEAGQCDGPTIDALWSAYNHWYATAASLTYYHRSSEAAALLRQGETFRLLGCPTVARATYELLLQRFPDPAYAEEREYAQQGLADLNPAIPLLRRPASARSADWVVPATRRGEG